MLLLFLSLTAAALPEDLRLSEDPPGLTLAYVALGVQQGALQLEGEEIPHWGSSPALVRGGTWPPLTVLLDRRAEEGRGLAEQLDTHFEGRVWVELDESARWSDLEVALRSAEAAGFDRILLEAEGQRVGPVELTQSPRPFVDARPVRVHRVRALALYDGERVAPVFRVDARGEDRLTLGRAARKYEVDCARLYAQDEELVALCEAGEPRPVCLASLEELPELLGVVVLIDPERPVAEQLGAVARAKASERPVAIEGGSFDCPEELADARELQRAEAAFVGTLVSPR